MDVRYTNAFDCQVDRQAGKQRVKSNKSLRNLSTHNVNEAVLTFATICTRRRNSCNRRIGDRLVCIGGDVSQQSLPGQLLGLEYELLGSQLHEEHVVVDAAKSGVG